MVLSGLFDSDVSEASLLNVMRRFISGFLRQELDDRCDLMKDEEERSEE